MKKSIILITCMFMFANAECVRYKSDLDVHAFALLCKQGKDVVNIEFYGSGAIARCMVNDTGYVFPNEPWDHRAKTYIFDKTNAARETISTHVFDVTAKCFGTAFTTAR